MRQTLEFFGHQIEVIYDKGYFWSIVSLSENVRIYSNPQTTRETAVGIGKLNLLKWQSEQNRDPSGITLLSDRQLPIIYRNHALIQLLDELGIASHENSYQNQLNFLKTPLAETQDIHEFIKHLKGRLGNIIEISELQCQVVSWSIPLIDHFHFQAN
jgi:hypothetical protein